MCEFEIDRGSEIAGTDEGAESGLGSLNDSFDRPYDDAGCHRHTGGQQCSGGGATGTFA